MIKYKLSATIPVVQYGNMTPEIELEGEDINELHEKAIKHIQGVWRNYGERPLPERTSRGVEKTTFTGETIFFDNETHKYTDQEGRVLLSGSTYAGSKEKPFDKVTIAKASAKSWGVPEEDIGNLWELNGRLSTEYGSMVHTALEIYHRYKNIGEKIQAKKELDENYALPKVPYLRNAVLDFDRQFGSDALSEVLVSDVKGGRAGTIDRLQILDAEKKLCAIGDYKTNFEMSDKNLLKYSHQLSFYAEILEAHGWKVQSLDLYHYLDGWTHHVLERQTVEV